MPDLSRSAPSGSARRSQRVRRSHPGPAILGRFYASTYRRLLGVTVDEVDLVEMLIAAAAAYRDDPGAELRPPFADALADPLTAYMNETALQERFAEVAVDLRTRPRPSVLDLGCGDGSALRLLAETLDAPVLVGVDPIHAEPSTEIGNGSTLVLVPTLDAALEVRPRYDLVCAMYTLHHMPAADAESCVERLAGALAPRGKLFVVEDDPSFDEPCVLDLDRAFAELGDDGRRAVVELNDFWSNVVVHRRPHEYQHYSFRSRGEWIELFGAVGLTPVHTRGRGFNPERLHGVPTFESIWQRASEPDSPS